MVASATRTEKGRQGEGRLMVMKEDVIDIVGMQCKWKLNNVRILQEAVEANFSLSGKL